MCHPLAGAMWDADELKAEAETKIPRLRVLRQEE